jgi:hypothetical protein
MIIGAISDWCESAWGSGLFNLFERRVAYQSGIISRFAVKDSDSDSDSAGLKFERSTVQKLLYAIIFPIIFPIMTHGTIIFPIIFPIMTLLFFIIFPIIFNYDRVSAPGKWECADSNS